MSASVESLVALVDDLFEFVQLEADAIEAERERARLDEVVDSAVAACDGQATSKGLDAAAPTRRRRRVPSAPRG